MKILCVAAASTMILGGLGTAFSQTTQPASHPLRVMGTVGSIDGTNLIVHLRQPAGDSTDVSVPTDSNSSITLDSDPATLKDLQAGMEVSAVEGPAIRGAVKARISATSPGLFGTIVKIDGNQLTMTIAQPGKEPKEVIVTTGDKTRVLFLGMVTAAKFNPGGEKKIADLQPEMRIKVIPLTGTADKIFVSPTRSARPSTSQPSP